MSIYMNDELKSISESQIQAINEVYFGETDDIKRLQGILSNIRAKSSIKNIVKINGSKYVSEFNRAVEDIFGFKNFALHVLNDYTSNAFTYPVSNRLDTFGNSRKKLDYSKSRGFRFNNRAYSTIVFITSGIMFSKQLTDREVMAIILHEIGHSFTESYASTSFFNNIIRVLGIIDLAEDAMHMSPESLAKIAFLGTNTGLGFSSDTLKKIEKNKIASQIVNSAEFLYKLERNLEAEYWQSMNVYKSIKKLLKYGGDYIAFNMKVLASIIPGVASKPGEILLSILNVTNEKLSDNFATMYGYGPDLASGLPKLKRELGGGYINKKIIRKVPILNNSIQVFHGAFSMLIHPITTHPTTISRLKDQAKMLKSELKSSDLDKNMKKEIESQIVIIESEINKITDTSLSLKNNIATNPDVMDNVYNKLLSHLFGGDIRNILASGAYKTLDAVKKDKIKKGLDKK